MNTLPFDRETRLAVRDIEMRLFWRGDRLARIAVADNHGDDTTDDVSLNWDERSVLASLRRFVSGGDPHWPDLPYDFDGLTDFAKDVLAALKTVPAGQTVSYAELAELAGHPGAARAVGRVMALNPFPVLIPCHRVVGASGEMTGYTGPGVAFKRRLLTREGALDPATGQLIRAAS